MNKKKLIGLIVGIVLVATSGGLALGANVPWSIDNTKPFYACVTGVNGNITKVSNSPSACPKGTKPITWNQVGPKGDTGEVGPRGPKGERGPAGVFDGNSATIGGGEYLTSGSSKYRFYWQNNASPWVKVDDTWWVVSDDNCDQYYVCDIKGYPTYGYFWGRTDDVLLYTESDCQGPEYGYLNESRAIDDYYGNTKTVRMMYKPLQDVAIQFNFTSQLYKAHFINRSADAIWEFLSWRDARGCHGGQPSWSYVGELGSDWISFYNIAELTPIDSPNLIFDQFLSVE